ncbi:sodium:solute symporter family protein [Virgibacillus alimentarius]|uniref:SSS family solute:Na+ symporter n=1 Tax=Virgibacillus alimentarius TaxID=698769 RepID=A0ABS4SCD0_9BACI|nr:sodium:solute symporter family protein [Virgibacillus alimentarius]MBP2259161.1 SSS family solute:Na+ symporter [Virgibacillus alimentarius]
MHLLIIIVYIIGMMILGMYFAKREVKTGEDFLVAGRRLPGIVLAGTLLSTWVGSGTILGGASFVYQYGPLAGILYFIGAPIGIIVLYYVSGRVRELEKNTLPQILEIKFGRNTRLVASVFMLLAYTGIATYQFVGGGHLLSIITGLSENSTTLIIAVLVIFLATTGGMFSVAYTDSISSLIIVFGLLLALPFVLPNVDGFSGLENGLSSQQLTWSGGLTATQLIGFALPTFALILGDQNMYNRFSSAKNSDTAKKSTILFFFGNAFVLTAVIIIAAASVIMYPTLENTDMAILQVASDGIPTPVGSLILVAAIGLIITTSNSFLLSGAGNLVYDIYTTLKGELSQKNYLRYNRIAVVIIGVIGYLLGRFFPDVLEMQMYAYTMYGATITPVVLATFFWKRATTAGALSSIIIGGSATIIWEQILNKPLDWNSVIVALPLSVLTLITVSLITNDQTVISE